MAQPRRTVLFPHWLQLAGVRYVCKHDIKTSERDRHKIKQLTLSPVLSTLLAVQFSASVQPLPASPRPLGIVEYYIGRLIRRWKPTPPQYSNPWEYPWWAHLEKNLLLLHSLVIKGYQALDLALQLTHPRLRARERGRVLITVRVTVQVSDP